MAGSQHPVDGAAADPLRVAFERVVENFDDDLAHTRVLALAKTLGRIPDVGTMYRELRARDPSRARAIDRRIDRLFAAVMKDLELTRTDPEETSRIRRKLLFIALVLALLMIGCVIFAAAQSPH